MKKVLFALFLALTAFFVLPLRGVAQADSAVDVAGYCQAQGLGKASSEGRDWYCEKSSFIVSMNDVCTWQFGRGARPVSENVLDPNSWSCEKAPKKVLTLSKPLPSTEARLDVYRYCVSNGKGEPHTSGRDWYCANSNFNLSMDDVCRWQNGNKSRAVSDDYMNPFAWRCEQ